MVSVIGLYDSGIGGLTTLAILKKAFKNEDFFYYADNKNHPFGNKSPKELQLIISNAISKIKNNSDVVVLACNTASTVYNESGVIRLLPRLDFQKQEDTLLLATRCTLSNMNTQNIKTAETDDLASLIEIQASINQIKGNLDMSALRTYLKIRLCKFRGVKKVVLGCSHYPYCKDEIKRILGDAEFVDGNDKVISSLKKQKLDGSGCGKVAFAFSGSNEKDKYERILSLIEKSDIMPI